MKKILYFYPENPLLVNQGNNSRANTLLKYFSQRKVELDFIGEERFDFDNRDIQNLEQMRFIKSGFLLKRKKKRGFYYLFTQSIPNKIFRRKNRQLNRIKYGQKEEFNAFIKNKEYDYIIISYAYWMPLIIDNPNIGKAKIVVDTHDFLTAQFKKEKNFEIGRGFQKELELLNKADIIWAISREENYLFSQFLDKPVHTVVHGIKDKSTQKKESFYDVIYVASNNPHNVESAKWFFEEVYPYLSKNIKICVVGKINALVHPKENVIQKEYVEELDELYQVSKIAICPMLSGTGLKIKVVEALSYAMPVVCTKRGIDGLLNKLDNGCAVEETPYLFAKQIERLLSDDSYYKKYSNNAKSFFNKVFEVEMVFKKIDDSLKIKNV